MSRSWKSYNLTSPPATNKKVKDSQWNIYKGRILELYLHKKLKLEDVRETIWKETGFRGTLAMYKHRLRVWVDRDNIPMKYIKIDPKQKQQLANKIREREIQGKPSEIRFKNGKRIAEQDRILRVIKRYKVDNSRAQCESNNPSMNGLEDLTVATPAPYPDQEDTSVEKSNIYGSGGQGQDLQGMLGFDETAVKQFICRVGEMKIATIPIHIEMNRRDLLHIYGKHSTRNLEDFIEAREADRLVTSSVVASRSYNWEDFSVKHPTREECLAICREACCLLEVISSVFQNEKLSIDLDWAIKTEQQLSDEHLLIWLQLQATRKLSQGQFGSAIDCFSNILRLQETHPQIGVGHPDTIFQLKAIAALHVYNGQPDEAGRWLKRVLELQFKLQGPGHLDTIQTAGYLIYTLLISNAGDSCLIPELQRLLICCEKVLLEEWDRSKTRMTLTALRSCFGNVLTRPSSATRLECTDFQSKISSEGDMAVSFSSPGDIFLKWCHKIITKLGDPRRSYMATYDHLELLVTKCVVIQDLKEELFCLSSPRKHNNLAQLQSLRPLAYGRITSLPRSCNDGSITLSSEIDQADDTVLNPLSRFHSPPNLMINSDSVSPLAWFSDPEVDLKPFLEMFFLSV